MKLQAVTNRKLYIQIADQIREKILSGEAQPGRQLPSERDLAQSLGVSRPTVREALIALEVAGLVEVRVGVGAFVRAESRQPQALTEHDASPIEVMAVRRLLEPEAAALAAAHIEPGELQRLETVLASMEDETRHGSWSARNDRALHLTIAEACKNEVLREQLEFLWNMRSQEVDKRFHEHLAGIAEVREQILRDHQAISRAILARDSDGARAAMTRHLDYVARAMFDVWD
ncbi:FadR/GntR family transcriptional regulator [Frigidibacter sp. ROC022]|uniref:FadR/GntR family transcriptional regulator n=1 Tax=Frigidibacter sp. ROC022 TaxID=2971796 RepID=UPI00215B1971|nr:FadR/GntR family transcriptional regulator [Frigidibacter sp. ROC022]MCR8723725.1 FadR family transcriptional regulator [Frigidibacter sp. ROC022]